MTSNSSVPNEQQIGHFKRTFFGHQSFELEMRRHPILYNWRVSRGPKYSSGMALKVFFKQKWSVFLLQQSQHFFQVVVNCQRMPIALQPFQLSHYKKGCTYSGRLVAKQSGIYYLTGFTRNPYLLWLYFPNRKSRKPFIKQKQFVYHYLNLQKEKEKLRGACDMFNVHHIPKCHWINCPIFDNAWQKPSFVKNRNDIDPHMSEIFKGVLNCGQMRTTVIEMSKVFLTSSPFWGEFWDG